jgi:hypothetical protein
MATLDQLTTALRNADAAGDTAAATKLATTLKAMRAGGGAPDFTQFDQPAPDRPGLADAAQRVANGQGGPAGVTSPVARR